VPPADNVILGDDGQVGPDDDTAPLPVILHDQPRPRPASAGSRGAAPPPVQPAAGAQQPRQRGPFEPPEQSTQPDTPEPASSPPEPAPVAKVGAAKLDQIKDLYLTAEAIGDEALERHFQQVSDRQRQLIREYFDQTAAKRPEGSGQSKGQDQR
jgi:hypothetical protein